MRLQLPDFTGKKCLSLTACGNFLPEDDPLEGRDSVDEWKTAQYTRSGTKVFVRWGLRRTKGKTHVHVDLASRELFVKGPLPQSKHKAEEIQETFAPFIGRKIEVEVEGFFRVSTEELPALIRSTLVETRVDKVLIQMTGGTLSVQGAPIHRITWRLSPNTSEARIELAARQTTNIDESYLDSSLTVLESAFRVFILGKSDDV